MTRQKRKTKHTHHSTTGGLSFLDHLRELRRRLFAVAVTFLLISGAALPFFDTITSLLIKPLGNKYNLIYLTPGGAFSFMLEVCLYIGLIGSLPVIIYQLYRFIMPAVKTVALKKVLQYTAASFVLAGVGIAFAYIVSLPAALYFLTNMNIAQVNPMLTVDSYLSFVMTYLLAGAALFQLPLLMLIINSVTPLKPSKLLKVQDKVILGSFIVGAVISPTPDMLNQTLLAAPLIVMYYLSIVLIWRKNRRRKPGKVAMAAPAIPQPDIPVGNILTDFLAQQPAAPTTTSTIQPKPQPVTSAQPVRRRSIDGTTLNVPRRVAAAPMQKPAARPAPTKQRVAQRRPFQHKVSMDGFFVHASV